MFERRLKVLLGFLAIFCLILAVRAVALQAIGRSHWEEESAIAARDEVQLGTTRGRILDVKGRELARDEPCTDVCVDYSAIDQEENWEKNSKTWARNIARNRVRQRVENYSELSLAQRIALLEPEVDRVKADIVTMWHDLARAADKSDEEMDEIRRQIVRRVQTHRRTVWYRRFEKAQSAATTKPSDPSWYAWLLGENKKVSIDDFEIHFDVEHQPHVIIPRVSDAVKNQLQRDINRYPGLKLREGVTRVYPYGSVACQTIGRMAPVSQEESESNPLTKGNLSGFLASDRTGREGMERMLEPQLRGRRGLQISDDDSEAITEVQPVPGGDVPTTLDIALQTRIESAFEKVTFAANKSMAETLNMPGAAVVIDIPTGQVRSLVSWPTYDLNRFEELFPKLSKDVINRPMMNRALNMAVEPGSTVKPIVGIGAITSRKFRADETIRCDGFLVVNNQKFSWGKCWTQEMYKLTHMTMDNPPPSAELNFPQALQRSCNVFHETLAYRMGLGEVSFWFDKFGLGRPTGIGLPESSGLLPDQGTVPAAMRLNRTCLAGIGEGYVGATPIQMANVAATIARNGIWKRPTLGLNQSDPGIDLHLDPQAVAEAKQGMHDVVNTPAGSGWTARSNELIFSGKTGSAQTSPFTVTRRDENGVPLRNELNKVIHDPVALGHYGEPNPVAPWYRAIGEKQEKTPAHGWMIGFAPSDHPKIAFAVLVEYGGGGGTAAGSVVKQLLDACVQEGYLSAEEAR